MRYVFRDAGGAFDLTSYEDYLEQERERLVQFLNCRSLLDIERFTLAGSGSFHDSRIQHLNVIANTPTEAGSAHGGLQVELRLKGPYFDRYFDLAYVHVGTCKVEVRAPDADLLIHEIRTEGNFLTHEIYFDGGGSIEIVCGRLHFQEVLL